MICILLSTYNGERFLAEQIQSLFAQTDSQWKLLVRDDGSSDKTCELLAEFAAQDQRIQILESDGNLGAVASFLFLMTAAGDADYYAFCDQDDVWDSDKLLRSRQTIAGYSEQPAMYCSRSRLVDQHLNGLGLSRNYTKNPSFGNALVQNIATGCTVLLNRKAFKLICSRPPDSNNIIMHDWWCYLLVSAFGQVVFDPEPTMDYRQHSANGIGELKGFAFWLKRYRRFCNRAIKLPLARQVQEFKYRWGEFLSEPDCDDLSRLLDVMNEKRLVRRFGLLTRISVARQSMLDSLIFRLMLLLRNYG